MPLIAATLFLCLVGTVTEPDALGRFLDDFQRIQTLESRFEQQVETAAGLESATGMVWLRRPDRLKWEYQQPERKVFFLRKNRYQFYLPAENQLVVQDLEPAELDETPLVFILGGRGRLLGYYSSQLVEAKDGRWRYLLTARKTGTPFPKVVLTLSGNPLFIEEMVLHEDSGSVYTYRFSNVRFDPKLPGDLFDFRPPPGVEIVRME